MTAVEAVKILDSLVQQVMASGGFKKFADLDTVREALRVLDSELLSFLSPSKGGADELGIK